MGQNSTNYGTDGRITSLDIGIFSRAIRAEGFASSIIAYKLSPRHDAQPRRSPFGPPTGEHVTTEGEVYELLEVVKFCISEASLRIRYAFFTVLITDGRDPCSPPEARRSGGNPVNFDPSELCLRH